MYKSTKAVINNKGDATKKKSLLNTQETHKIALSNNCDLDSLRFNIYILKYKIIIAIKVEIVGRILPFICPFGCWFLP